MDKLLKILFAIELVLIVAIIVLSIGDNQKMPTAYAIKENPSLENTSFKILTKAVCEEKSDYIFCNDRLFAICDNKEHLINDDNFENFTECSNLKLNLSEFEVKGNGTFRKV